MVNRKVDPIQVLIVDDSALVRQALMRILSMHSMIEILGAAPDPFVASEIMKKRVPDVIVLDLEMPRMDGLTFLKKIMEQHPIPVVICSSLIDVGSEAALKALEFGAVDVIQKPLLGSQRFIEDMEIRLCDTIRAASQANLSLTNINLQRKNPSKRLDELKSQFTPKMSSRVVAVGASTGGTEALRVFLEMLTVDSPGVVIAQHMPAGFTASFAKRLDRLCRIAVKEAEDGDACFPGRPERAPVK